MTIERTEGIQWHAEGTLAAVTRWVTSHVDGIAELFKNTRRAYQEDRLDVSNEHRAAVLLLQDGKTPEFSLDEGPQANPARVAVLDVGGAALEDLEAWRVWHDPNASRRRLGVEEEVTQGNGGKAYLYAMFTGLCRFLGESVGKRNCMGFEGTAGSEERGTPGWVPSHLEGREVEVPSFTADLNEALEPYEITVDQLPRKVRDAITARQAFTLVEGVEPVGLYKGRIDTDDLLTKILRHDQFTDAVEQLDVFVIHNGQPVNDGRKLQLPPITPYSGLEQAIIIPIPDQLPMANGQLISTTESASKRQGRLTLSTSKENMYHAYKNLRPRWRIVYRTGPQPIGSKEISILAPATPGAAYVYGTVELAALDPGYIETGRKRPKDGPLVEALDLFMTEKIREVAKRINDLRKQELDERSLDEVHEENRRLDEFKNSYLPSGQGEGGSGDGEPGRGRPDVTRKRKTGKEPFELEYEIPEEGVQIGKGVKARMAYLLGVSVKDIRGRAVPSAKLEWSSSDLRVAQFSGGLLEAKNKGKCDVWVRVKGTSLESEHIPLRVWTVEHVFLSPRELEIPVPRRQQIIAEVTDDDGERSTDVLLDWAHDAEDQLLVRISPRGWVTGNREGRTAVTAGAEGLWAKRPVEVVVTKSDRESERAGGFPRLLLTDRDTDPETGQPREGNPDAPALWQEPADFVNNIWWLNLQSPEAASAFQHRSDNSEAWRMFHVGKLIQMVELVWMDEDFTRKGEAERPDYWTNHRAALERWQVQTVQAMWEKLQTYVRGGLLDMD